MSVLSTMLSGAVLYAPGAFFFYPWKPPLLLLVGDSYAAGYHHFRRDHSDAMNLILHCVALCWQLLSNFGLLAELDAVVGGQYRVLSLLSAITWCATLWLAPAPFLCSLASTASIVGAYFVAPHLRPRELEVFMLGTFIVVVCFSALLTKEGLQRLLGSKAIKGGLLFGVAMAARLTARQWEGVFVTEARYANVALAALMVSLSLLSKPVVPCVAAGTLVVRSLGELTGQDILLFFGGAFFAQLSQGIAHDVSRQKATLLSHQDSIADRHVRLAFEWSHCVYFPNLLFHSCYQSLAAARKPA